MEYKQNKKTNNIIPNFKLPEDRELSTLVIFSGAWLMIKEGSKPTCWMRLNWTDLDRSPPDTR